jgi:hypothetical protein
MRHVWSLLAGIVIAPLAWLVIAYGQAAISDSGQIGADRPLWFGLILLALVGLALGTVGSLRVSPAGPLVVASSYVGATVFLIAAPDAAQHMLPDVWLVLGELVVPASPISSGVLGLIGTMLLVAVVSAQRWRSWPKAGTPDESSGDTLASRDADRDTDRVSKRDSFNGFADLRTPADDSDFDTPSWSAPTKV